MPLPPTSIQSLRGISCLCADKLISTPFELSVAKKRVCHSFILDDKLKLDHVCFALVTDYSKKESPMPDGALSMVRYGSTICAADQNTYKILHIETDTTIPLFPYDQQSCHPLMTVIGENEFLVVSNGGEGAGLGVFVTASGEPTRGTLEWPSYPISIGMLFIISKLISSILPSFCCRALASAHASHSQHL